MPEKELFPDKSEGDVLGASHVNKLNRAARAVTSALGTSFVMGHGPGESPFPPFIQIPIEVIAESCDGDTDLVEIRPLYYDSDSATWKLNDKSGPYCLDPSVFDLSFSTGDQLVAFWNSQRGMFLPLNPGSGCDTIHFTIISADCLNKRALVLVDKSNCGCSSVPEESTAFHQLFVHDTMGCHLDEPDADLVGRTGAATYMLDRIADTCQWEIDDLCCDPLVCS